MPEIACAVFSPRREVTSICVVSSNVKYVEQTQVFSIVIATIAGDYMSPWV